VRTTGSRAAVMEVEVLGLIIRMDIWEEGAAIVRIEVLR
jgi:hypothetical protein